MGLPTPQLVLLAFLVAERSAELALSRANLLGTRGSAAGGTLEWTAMILVHAGLLALPPLESSLLGCQPARGLFAGCAVAILAAQGLRYWSIRSLGRAWNARARVDPRLPVVDRGPYRWIRHPNYLAVLVEFTAIPMAFGAWRSWIVLNVLHLPLIVRRIRAEERLLAALPGYEERMKGKQRFLPLRERATILGDRSPDAPSDRAATRSSTATRADPPPDRPRGTPSP